MRKNKLIASIVAVALIAVVAIGGTLAYFTDSDEATNVFTMGKVDGDLTEPEWNPEEDGKDVMPGDLIDKDPTITLAEDSQDAYVRFAVTYEGLSEEQFESLTFLKDGEAVEFYKVNNTYYFLVDKALSATESYVLFDQVQIPTTWGNEMASKEFSVTIQAQLVQAANFDNTQENWESVFKTPEV